jgi:hypothetical protein
MADQADVSILRGTKIESLPVTRQNAETASFIFKSGKRAMHATSQVTIE